MKIIVIIVTRIIIIIALIFKEKLELLLSKNGKRSTYMILISKSSIE